MGRPDCRENISTCGLLEGRVDGHLEKKRTGLCVSFPPGHQTYNLGFEKLEPLLSSQTGKSGTYFKTTISTIV